VCGQEFETERKLHSHLKKHDLRVAAYYQKYYPRYDLHDGKIIKFKSKDYYFNTDFNTRTNQLKWLDTLSDRKKLKSILKNYLERKEKKINLFSLSSRITKYFYPSVISYEKKLVIIIVL
jgi:tricorn protease-like protein